MPSVCTCALLSAHKIQGSQVAGVIVFAERVYPLSHPGPIVQDHRIQGSSKSFGNPEAKRYAALKTIPELFSAIAPLIVEDSFLDKLP
jgi:hypothetical protein